MLPDHQGLKGLGFRVCCQQGIQGGPLLHQQMKIAMKQLKDWQKQQT
jgi:hypothetical protein